jgi:hypothetical protein
LNELGDFFRPRFDLGRIIANEFVEIEELMLVVSGTSVPERRLLSSDWLVTAGAFIGTNPTDEPITSGLPHPRPILPPIPQ